MKRLFALITALLCILLLVPSAALATETEIPTGIGLSENTATYEAFDTPMTDVPEYRFVDPEKANQATAPDPDTSIQNTYMIPTKL